MNKTLVSSESEYAAAFARKGGQARARSLSKARLTAIARKAAAARWAGHTAKKGRKEAK